MRYFELLTLFMSVILILTYEMPVNSGSVFGLFVWVRVVDSRDNYSATIRVVLILAENALDDS